MSKFKDFWDKVKSVKHIEIYIALLIGLIICSVYFTLFTGSGKTDTNNDISTEEFTTSEEYVDYLENKLCNVLSKISGVGNVSAIITLETGFTYEYATDTETKTTTSGSNETSITTDTIIIVDGEPVVIKEIYPVIKGVVIVAEGSEDFKIKMDIMQAVVTILEVDESEITILS